ncbi:30S ribosomal protein S12 methylthiotransferase RimO [Zeimonas arvi]|uniref:Ribosomal protein uS12 methylthiotransferase RimO n=1 Tax=Zeimonas arvi TaxID=2498847 RepID=A0A5C8P1Z5_9BURK|nr:30S ribosomal protein S12 methylthiotransferase RimO [Zeimonas arvi]TXL67213.1 30S ribosomal protein S12 methylthiotransferase RimO [Zeimonas arvi]
MTEPARSTRRRPPKAPKVGFVSLGCPKALVDSERIITQLRAEGYEIAGDYTGSDLVVVNTCGFIDEAVQESLDAIGEALAENGKVIVTGCLGARPGHAGGKLVEEVHPRVLAVTGPHAADEVMSHVHAHLPRPHDPFTDLVPEAGVKLTPKHYAYLKISEGCNHRCSFCIIPSMRGDLVSRPIGEVVREAEALVRGGVKELLVISQDTSAYGVDVKYRTGFVNGRPVRTRMTELVKELAQLGAWVRLHYVYPYPHVDEVLPLMAEGKVLPYLDVPFQHAHPRILKLMKRPASGERNIERIRAWRAICPDLTIRSTFIAGFPGETEAEFEHLLDFLREAELDRVGCFAYSPVEGASANELPGALPDEVRHERQARFMDVQQTISERRLRRWVGREAEVLVDAIEHDRKAKAWRAVARSQGDAPEIDGVVYVDLADEKRAMATPPGSLLRVRIDEADEHDLYASAL